MLKRKPSTELDGHLHPHVLGSVFGDNPTRRQRKRLFRSGNHNKPSYRPHQEPAMTELLDFILQHEEAFQNQYRLASLYADFRQQLDVNPEGYQANIAAWTKAITNAARAGVIPTYGATHDLLNIQAGEELARALQHPQHGKPTCLPAVFHDAVQNRVMMPQRDFLGARENIYKTSWIPSPWEMLHWGLRQLGVVGQPSTVNRMGVGSFVILRNVEFAADEILKQMKEHVSAADRVLSQTEFSKRFANVLSPSASLTPNDKKVLLVYLERDRQAITFNNYTVKFKSTHESAPEPISHEDEAIANLRDTLANIQAQIPALLEKIAFADAAAREAVALKQTVRAKAALRSKKLAESTLQQRSDVALQLESVYTQLQSATDQVGIIAAMRAGADALKSLNEKVGGAEGVQGVVDAVNEQMGITEEITGIINETDGRLDEGEIEDEFEALEKAEKEKEEAEENKKTEQRLKELSDLEEKRREKEREREMRGKNEAEKEVDKAEEELSRLSFVKDNDEHAEKETKVALPA